MKARSENEHIKIGRRLQQTLDYVRLVTHQPSRTSIGSFILAAAAPVHQKERRFHIVPQQIDQGPHPFDLNLTLSAQHREIYQAVANRRGITFDEVIRQAIWFAIECWEAHYGPNILPSSEIFGQKMEQELEDRWAKVQ